jgi:ribose transport system substrate-binding protein
MTRGRRQWRPRVRGGLLALGAALLLALTACSGGAGGGHGGKPRIAVVPGSTAYFYWGSLHAGAQAAGQQLGADILWNGPASQTDVTGEINILQNFITQQVDGIAFVANDTKALQSVVDSANGAHIPIVSADSGIDPQRIPLVATDNIGAAGKAADYLAQDLGGTGKIATLPYLATSLTNQQRMRGFTDALAKHPGIQVVASQYTQGDVNTAQSVMGDILTAHPDLNAVFAGNEPGVVGAIRAIQSRGLAGKVKLVGFDNAPDEVTALRNGQVDALVVQNPYKIGFESVRLLLDMIHGKQPPASVDTGAVIATKANMNQPDIAKLLNPPVAQ